jgi:hypothetical protein
MAHLSIPGRFNRALQKFLSIKGGALVTEVSGEIMPIFTLFFGTENRYLEGWDRYADRFLVPPVAAKFGAVRIRNAAGSGAIIVVEKMIVENVVAHEYLLQGGPSTADLTTVLVLANQALDLRSKPQPSAILSTDNLAAVPSSTLFMGGSVQANGQSDLILTDNQELPILPGGFLEIIHTTANGTLACSFWWRERALEDSEQK